MRIVTTYKTNAKGRGQIVAKADGKQYTHNYDSVYSSETNHGHAAGLFLVKRMPVMADYARNHNIEHDSNDSGTVHTFTL